MTIHNLCTTCGLDFGSVAAFDKHRVGKHAYLASPELPDGRRCLTEAELPAKGFGKNTRGTWTIAADLDKARALREAA